MEPTPEEIAVEFTRSSSSTNGSRHVEQVAAHAKTRKPVTLYERAGVDVGESKIEVPEGETCIIWSNRDGYFEVQYGHGDTAVRGYAQKEHFHDITYRILLNLKLCDEFEKLYARTLTTLAEKYDTRTVHQAFEEKRTYAHFTLCYDFEINDDQLVELVSTLDIFARTHERVPLQLKGCGSFGNSVIYLDVNREHPEYRAAMDLHLSLVETLKTLTFVPSIDVGKIHWHSTVAYKDFEASQQTYIEADVERMGVPIDCSFDNITIMAKVGPTQAYAGTALPAKTFMLQHSDDQ